MRDMKTSTNPLSCPTKWRKNSGRVNSEFFFCALRSYHQLVSKVVYIVLCEFESERKWIVEAVPTTWQEVRVFNASFVDKTNIFLWHLQKRRYNYLHGSICQ